MLTGGEWVLALCLLVSGVALILAVLALAQARRQAQATQRVYDRLGRELALANSGAMGMGQRLLSLERKLQEAAQQAGEDSAHGDYDMPYSQAAGLFEAGVEPEEVARRCGLSRGEASLMAMMHRARKPG
ncbi:DUF2802 domain-containing protein [Marinimicrobium alkaliphilum]|uniref:DUF2802 domain-containing protein n=1 Tax=Marinimicrobium alkaliphilum TaxID=2202654 RepID=UPI000DB945DD|nr:DUF2802 domain-containing protein [Marinimicrobium alkaliphilum]